jgi:hypothetical protein
VAGDVRTYQTGGGWVVADASGWLPGSFETEEAALASVGSADGPGSAVMDPPHGAAPTKGTPTP